MSSKQQVKRRDPPWMAIQNGFSTDVTILVVAPKVRQRVNFKCETLSFKAIYWLGATSIILYTCTHNIMLLTSN